MSGRAFSLVSLGIVMAAVSFAASNLQRVRFTPKFTPGETLRYQIDSTIMTNGQTTTPIENPEGASLLKQTANLIVRLEVLSPSQESSAGTGSVHLRVTFEKSSATAESDAYDPGAAAIEEQYSRLEGRSMEFTFESGGKLSNVKGLEDVLANPSAEQTVRSWMTGLSSTANFPRGGITVGQKWNTEQPLTGTPLAGLIWRAESTYTNNEPCRSEQAPANAKVDADLCASILTRFEILRRGPKGATTPEDYRKNGLRTAGTWTGSGETLDSVSLGTGRLINSTQTSLQDMDFQIASAVTGSRMIYKGHVQTHTEIMLLPEPPPSPEAHPQTVPRGPAKP
jgi:hypothetical protein